MPHVDGVERAADDADLPCGHGVGLEVAIAPSLPEALIGFVHWAVCLSHAQSTRRFLPIGNSGN